MGYEPVPFSVITGFLGAGKTTIINQLLTSDGFENTALIINEFGEVGIDHHLVDTADEDIIMLANGCICCSVRGALVEAIENLLARRDRGEHQIDRILVETTGLADPAPILHSIMVHPQLVQQVRLDGVIAVVDAVNGLATLDEYDQAVHQLALADRIVLSKIDLVKDQAELKRLKQRLASINPAVSSENLIESDELKSAPKRILNCGLWDPDKRRVNIDRWLNEGPREDRHDHHGHEHASNHNAGIHAFSLTSRQPISSGDLDMFFSLLETLHGPKLLRLKGIVWIAEDPDRPLVIHAVQQVFHPPMWLEKWPQSLEGDRQTKLVVITRDLPAKTVRKLFDTFSGIASIDTPDRAAYSDSPLSIPGMAGMKF